MKWAAASAMAIALSMALVPSFLSSIHRPMRRGDRIVTIRHQWACASWEATVAGGECYYLRPEQQLCALSDGDYSGWIRARMDGALIYMPRDGVRVDEARGCKL